MLEPTQRLKAKMDERRKEVQFQIGDFVMVHLNKARMQQGMPTKLQMRRVGPCKVLAKYGENAYKVDLPSDLAISPVFNIVDLIIFKREINQQSTTSPRVLQDLDTNAMPKKKPTKEDKVLESRVKKATGHQVYMEHLIKWKDQPEFEATWVEEGHFKKFGIDPALLDPKVPQFVPRGEYGVGSPFQGSHHFIFGVMNFSGKYVYTIRAYSSCLCV